MKVVAIVGTYRKGGVVDSITDEVLSAAAEAGAETNKIYLIDRHIEFCTNCRACTQTPGNQRGRCPLNDEMDAILKEIEQADALVLASPMNFWNVTAVMKRFVERLVCFADWPWGVAAPRVRPIPKTKRAAVVGSSACPAIVARAMTRMVGLLKSAADLLGAQRKKHVIFVGMAAVQQHQDLSPRVRAKARRVGKKLVC